jgi:hypothetical protein
MVGFGDLSWADGALQCNVVLAWVEAGAKLRLRGIMLGRTRSRAFAGVASSVGDGCVSRRVQRIAKKCRIMFSPQTMCRCWLFV